MGAREYFERIRDDGRDLARRRLRAQEMREQLGSHGQRYGSVGGGGSHDATGALTHVIAYEEEIERDEVLHLIEVGQATEILYGRSGRGGLAKRRGSVDADIICCHYLQGMTYAAIAEDVARPESDSPVDWCRQRAHRALGYIDRVGVATLTDS